MATLTGAMPALDHARTIASPAREEMAMSNQLGPLDVNCDAPSYPIVRASRRVGLEVPEDVRWCRMSHFLELAGGWKGLFHPRTWKKILGGNEVDERACSCGERLPALERVTFTFTTGREESYLLGQCPRCRTIFWEDT
jgi:hypothetical protein